jgi:mRNA interferase MazF
MPRTNLRDRHGRLPDIELIRLDRALIVFIGLAE